MRRDHGIQTLIHTTFFMLLFLIPSFSQEQAKDSTETAPAEKQFTTIQQVWSSPFKSQGETSTCWCFSTVSFLESEAHRLGRGDFELSQMFIVYHAFLEKAERHIRSHRENPFRGGGLSHDVIYLIKKYSAVPRSCYVGNQDSENKYDHREMTRALSGMLTGICDTDKDVPLNGRVIDGQYRWTWVPAFQGLLDAYIGKLPDSIEYKNRTLTPRQFADDVLRLPLEDYIEITSYSYLPFYSAGELLLPDNWLHYNLYYNVPMDDFLRTIDHSLKNGFSLCVDLHATHEEFECKKPYLLGFNEEKGIPTDQNKRDSLLDNWKTDDIHLVHIIGTVRDEKGNLFYKVKDSVGSEDGKGPVFNKEYLSEDFVRSRVLSFMIHKDALPADLSKKLGI